MCIRDRYQRRVHGENVVAKEARIKREYASLQQEIFRTILNHKDEDYLHYKQRVAQAMKKQMIKSYNGNFNENEESKEKLQKVVSKLEEAEKRIAMKNERLREDIKKKKEKKNLRLQDQMENLERVQRQQMKKKKELIEKQEEKFKRLQKEKVSREKLLARKAHLRVQQNEERLLLLSSLSPIPGKIIPVSTRSKLHTNFQIDFPTINSKQVVSTPQEEKQEIAA
eukprot:TRINITY_DN213_c0_g1_i3.p1 TRINITY_DN213_c0_g1~~TRINITY_DN213_c0_g1_i3.p1  ORF type:complete len:225 (-),score=62.87 TRINITY_DN213_c0_g1_i3:142-816(-)